MRDAIAHNQQHEILAQQAGNLKRCGEADRSSGLITRVELGRPQSIIAILQLVVGVNRPSAASTVIILALRVCVLCVCFNGLEYCLGTQYLKIP